MIVNIPNYGYLKDCLTTEQLAPIKTEIAEIQADFMSATDHTKYLAGNIQNEFTLVKSKDHIEQTLLPYFWKYYNTEYFYLNFNTMVGFEKKQPEVVLDTAWVNFQKKYEFNPIHHHDGIMSFALYIQIPYTIEEELLFNPQIPVERNRAGTFYFITVGTLGDIQITNIPTDKSYEGTFLMFPSRMKHCVHPFFSSDDYRISVSGNFKYKL